MVGETVGHYRIQAELGAGGMGVVYRARDLRLERDVALKVIRPEAASPTLRAAFLREAQLASTLNHPGIVTIYDIVSHGEAECIVMEFVAGSPLTSLIPPEGLPLERALRLGIGVGEALSAAHAAGIVHRDLKPANILVRAGDQIKILDFGLAKLVAGPREDAPTVAEASIFGNHLVGTLAYMAPEGARGEAVDQRADVFSLGAILYQMLAGRPPFTGPTPAALLYAVQFTAPPRLRERRAGVPAGLEAVIERALAKPVAERWAGAADLVRALRALGPGGGLPPEASQRPGDGREPGPSEAALPLSVGTLPWSEPPPPATAQASIAVLPFRSLSSDPEDLHLASGLAAEIGSALTGVPGLRLTSQQASMRLPADKSAPRLAAEALRVRYIVSGTLRRAGQRVRVTVELIDADDRVEGGARLAWSRSYDRSLTDIFAVQEDIAKAIVNALGGELIRATTGFAFRSPTQSLDAWGLARKAYHLWNYEFSLPAVAQALELLRRAVELDPDYGAAHAMLGFYLITTVINRMSQNLEADRQEALAAAELACRLAPEDPEVLEHAALVWQHTGQYERAVTCLKRAVRVAPYDLVAWGYLGFVHACAGGPAELREARQILARLLEDAPEHPSRAFWHQFVTIAALRQADYAAAAEHGRQAVEMQPGFVFNQVFYAEALCRLGRMEEGRTVLATVATYNPYFTLAVFEDVSLHATRSPQAVTALCGILRENKLLV